MVKILVKKSSIALRYATYTYVTMGIEVARERHGFDYNDEAAVAEQFERIKKRYCCTKIIRL
ncbi:MAG: hypothetical protein H6573_25135 [Lewinellaceae bacterium]|nr:hypothetical protein [Lewinellaceae bacterium]